MMKKTDDEPRIFQGDEVKQAIRELFSYRAFVDGMKAFLPEPLTDLILRAKNHCETIVDFQKNIIRPFLKTIEELSITGLSSAGLEHLSRAESYLFISNHRDIGLDSALLNMILHENGMPTSQIAIGDNLMAHRISELIFRINKSFVVKRTGTPRELYEHSVKLSTYIRDQITRNLDSVWIAQREGRSKDGNDRTQIGVLKMLSLSSREGEDLKTHFRALRIVPVAISYEYDPCAMLKTEEFLNKQANPAYKKSFQDDVKQILAGLKGDKGRVHFHFGKPLQDELDVLDAAVGSKQQLERLTALIDKEIHLNYRLFPVNYIACDLLTDTQTWTDHYTAVELERQVRFFNSQLAGLDEARLEAGRRYLLGIYANPVINAAAYGNPK